MCAVLVLMLEVRRGSTLLYSAVEAKSPRSRIGIAVIFYSLRVLFALPFLYMVSFLLKYSFGYDCRNWTQETGESIVLTSNVTSLPRMEIWMATVLNLPFPDCNISGRVHGRILAHWVAEF